MNTTIIIALIGIFGMIIAIIIRPISGYRIDKIEEDRKELEKVNKNMNNDIQELKNVIKRMGYNWNKN